MNLSFDGDCKGDQFRFTPGHTRIPNTHWGHKPCMRLRLQVRSFLVSALINVHHRRNPVKNRLNETRLVAVTHQGTIRGRR